MDKRLSFYSRSIAKLLTKHRIREIDPRHVEAYMRVEYRTLDGLSAAKFEDAVIDAVQNICFEGKILAEKLAQSYGL